MATERPENKKDIRVTGITPVEGEDGLVKVHYVINGVEVTVRRSTGFDPKQKESHNPTGDQI